MMIRACVLSLLFITSLPAVGYTQVVPPPVTYMGPRDSAIPVLATQAWFSLAFDKAKTHRDVVRALSDHYPKDSLLALSAQGAQAWIAKLQTVPVAGLQLLPEGLISVTARQEQLAQRLIAQRLAEPKLSLQDQAFTLQMAVTAFANPDVTEYLPVAERYLAQLDALGPQAAYWQFNARAQLVEAYYRLGRSQDIIRTGVHMFGLVGAIPYHLRGFGGERFAFTYGAVIDALSGEHDGRARIRALNAGLMTATVPDAALVAHDSSFAWQGIDGREVMQSLINVSERVGTPGTPMVASYWVNRGGSRDSQMVSVADGKIHIIEVGSFTCGPCMAAVPTLNRLAARYADVDFTFLTATIGSWGNRTVDSRTEAERLAEHFLDKLKAKISIGIAFTPRSMTDEGLLVPTVSTTTWNADQYPQVSKPTFYVLDGKGMIRRVMLGFPERDFEANLAGIVEFLQREAHTTNQSAAAQ